MSDHTIQSVSKESRVFEPPTDFAKKARVPTREAYDNLYRQSMEQPEEFWGEQARNLHWHKPFTKVLTWDAPHVKWFEDGKTNLAYNALDVHANGARRDKPALIWEGEPGDQRTFTYHELWRETCRFSNVLLSLGVWPGDRVAIYMGMVPEAAIAMLACARIGAVHTVIFGGFAAEAVRDRVNDAEAKLVITQDGAYRRGQLVVLKEHVDRALEHCPTVKSTIVLRRTHNPIDFKEGRDHEWSELMRNAKAEHEAPALDSEHPLYILYTSGTTGKPKGVLHTTGGYMVGTWLTTRDVFDIQDSDIYWCTADVGWVTGHSYIVYGPLLNGATALMYEGAPNHPDPSRFWQIIEKHKVTIFYTAPTAIRAFVRWGDDHVEKHDLSSLRLLGSVGEPINPEAWMWYRRVVGKDKCPIVDTWWQTETGAMMITPQPGAISTKPGSCTLPFYGVSPKIFREDGTEAGPNEGGLLVIDRPWPSMFRTVWRNEDRYLSYFEKFPGKYFTGDGARRDEDGYFWVIGRVDDVVNVAGHRLGTAEIESALVSHAAVAEAAVVARPDELTGSALVAFVTLKGNRSPSPELKIQLLDHVAQEIGKFARPAAIRFADALPKTRSGKIMRRLLKDLASGNTSQGDTTTLEDISVLAKIGTEE